jgi:hypothetical protein
MVGGRRRDKIGAQVPPAAHGNGRSPVTPAFMRAATVITKNRKSGATERLGVVDPGPNATLPAAVAHLHDMLARAGEVRAARPEMRRMAAIFAVNAVLAFIMRIDDQRAPGSMTCLLDVWEALADLERDVVPPLFKLQPRRSRRRDSSDRERTKGAAAAAMSRLMDAGLGREEAGRRVANELRRGGVKLGGRRQLDGGTVASWRDQAKTAAPDGTGIATVYSLCTDGGLFVGATTVPSAVELDAQQREHFVRDVLALLSEVVARNA